MRKKTTKGRCEKRILEKCIGVCKTYSPIQSAFALILQEKATIKEFRTNVPLEDDALGYTTDFVAETTTGNILVRERSWIER